MHCLPIDYVRDGLRGWLVVAVKMAEDPSIQRIVGNAKDIVGPTVAGQVAKPVSLLVTPVHLRRARMPYSNTYIHHAHAA